MSVSKLYEITSKYIDPVHIHTIFELGSRDALEAVSLADHYPNAKVVAFECNPETYPLVQWNQKRNSRVESYPYAITDTDGTIDFYQSVHGNPGSSSIFKKTGKYDYIEDLVQNKITVPSVTLSTFLDAYTTQTIDIIWADLQGAELKALKGMKDYINSVKFIYTEIEFQEIYENQVLYDDLKQFLESKGFAEEHKNIVVQDWWGDAIFVNQTLLGNK